MTRTNEFYWQRAVVTGSGGAMGAAIAIELATGGATVVVIDRLAERTSAAVDAVRGAGGVAIGVNASVTRTEGADFIMSEAFDRLGGVDILVNNVGGSKGRMENPI